MRVLVTTTMFPRWKKDSVRIFIYDLCKALNKKGVEVIALAPYHEDAKFIEDMEGVRVYRYPYFFPYKYQKLCYGSGMIFNVKSSLLAKIQTMPFMISQILYTLIIARKEKVNLIHAHWILPQGFVDVISRIFLRIPVVVSVHGSDIFSLKGNFFRMLSKFTLRRCNYCTANSKATKEAILSLANIRGKMNIVPMGIDLERFRKLEMEKKDNIILTLGRLIEFKGQKYLIEAMPYILRKIPDAKLYIVGEGPEMENLKETAKRLNIEEKVRLWGEASYDDLPKFYNMADVFVLPSIITDKGETEGLGVVLLEAMASGVPVIGSNVGGIPDIIAHEKTGLLVSQKSPEELAEAIIRILEDEKLLQGLSKRGYEYVRENFSWESIADRFLKVYEDLLKV